MSVTPSIVVIALCIVAAVLEWLCMRSPLIPDNRLSLSGRRIKIVAYLILALRLAVEDRHAIDASSVAVLGLGLIAFADIIRCANRMTLPSERFQTGAGDHDGQASSG